MKHFSPLPGALPPRPVAFPVLLLLTFLGLPACQGPSQEGEATARAVASEPPPLHFHPDGTFTIVQFTDTQDDHEIDPRTVTLMEAVLDDQDPDLVVFTGDNVRAGPTTPREVMLAIDKIASPPEAREIPWVITFGNHDEDHTSETGWGKTELLTHYRSYPHNRNLPGPAGVHGTGNMHLPILGSDGEVPVFNIWLLDSGRYAPDSVGGQSVEADGLPGWDVIRPDQVAWYYETSRELEARLGHPIPALAFFHIPLQEFNAMWENRDRHQVVGEMNEPVSSGPFNSGLFAAMLDRGDVAGVFVGHDHVNDYVGNYFGIRLGYAANAGFGTYGLDGPEKDRMRGARVFHLREDDPRGFETFMVYAREYGIQ